MIVLDLARRDAGSGGLVTAATLAFLAAELRQAGERHLLVACHQPLDGSSGGDALLALLDADPRVIAVLAGHTHTQLDQAASRSRRRILAHHHSLDRRLPPAMARPAARRDRRAAASRSRPGWSITAAVPMTRPTCPESPATSHSSTLRADARRPRPARPTRATSGCTYRRAGCARRGGRRTRRCRRRRADLQGGGAGDAFA